MRLITGCINNLKKESSSDTNLIEDTHDYEKILKNQSKFSKKVASISFEEYLEKFTVRNNDALSKSSLHNPKRTKYDVNNPNKDKEDIEKILEYFSNAVGDSEVIELLTTKLLNNLKLK